MSWHKRRNDTGMTSSIKDLVIIAFVAILTSISSTSNAKAATGELGVRAVIVNRNSALVMSKLRALRLNVEDAVFSLPQTRNFHVNYTQKLFRCESIDCEIDSTAPGHEMTAGAVSIRIVATNTHQLAVKAHGDNRFNPAKPFLTPLTVIVSYE